MKTNEIFTEIESFLNKNNTKSLLEQIQIICDILKLKAQNYDWVGFYFANHEDRTLHLGPYAGEPTEHKVIPFGKGICGQVAESNNTFLVDDVYAQDNYIACSINVKSEIVVPLLVDGNNVGQIDIDSHTKNAFTKEDEDLLRQINQLVAYKIQIEKPELKNLRV